jgi:hypothetical protein
MLFRCTVCGAHLSYASSRSSVLMSEAQEWLALRS